MASVLLVDDDPNVLAGLSRALHKENYEIICADSAESALKMLSSLSVDVVVSDEEMSGMSGTALLAKVRELYPDTVRFILTGKASLPVAIKAINQGGISRFFMKPCNHFVLAVSIRQELERRDLILAARRLLQKVRQQSKLIEQLEQLHPQITEVQRDEDGAILLGDSDGDVSALMAEICRQLDK
ncbi:MAG TPA: response regulator [Acidobacteriota bacterium]|nr:response regulator [Acidobacteriota bacterium]